MAAKFQYILDFIANTEKFQKEIGGIKGTLKSVGVAAAAYFSTDAIVDFGRASISAYNDSIQAETALLTALKGRNDIQDSLIDQASELMGKTLFDDDEIVRAQSLVAAFVKEEDKIKTLIPLIQDMATAKQMDLAGAADLVTKTLAGEMNALGRYGIKVEGAAGSAERLEMIQKGLNDAFGGQAEAAAKVGAASLIQLENEYGNLKESVGRLMLAQENQQGSFTKVMAENTRALSGFLGKVAEFNEAGSDTSNSVLTLLMVRAGFISQASVDARIALNKAAKGLVSEMDDSVESFAPVNINVKQFESINTLTEKLKTLKDGLAEIDITDKASIATQQQKISATEAQIKSITTVTEASKFQAGSVGALGEEITRLNEKMANTNASDIKSIQIIGEKIQALEKQKKAIQDIASDPISFRTDSFGTIPTARVTGKLSVKNDDKAFDTKAKLDIDDFTNNAEKIKEANQSIQDEMAATEAFQQSLTSSMSEGFNAIGQAAIDGLGLAETGFGAFLGGMLSTVMELITMYLAQSIAASIAGSTAAGAASGPLAPITTPMFIAAGIAAVMGGFAAIPAFAEGGIVSGPTLGLMGEYPGASSNPEVIAPLSKLKALMGNSGGGSTIVLQPSIDFTGDRLRIMLNKVERNVRKRT